jgi:hypothetical protein
MGWGLARTTPYFYYTKKTHSRREWRRIELGIRKAHEAARRATRKGAEVQDPGIRLKSRTLFLGRQLAE